MTSLLDAPEIRRQVYPMSVETYHQMGELGLIGKDVELLRGIIVKKMSKSAAHEFTSQVLLETLMRAVPSQYTVRKEGPVTTEDSEPEPDISVVLGRPTDWLDAHPPSANLAIEVSISTRVMDEAKAFIYAETGVLEYWLVRPKAREVDVYRQPTAEGYQASETLRDGQTLTCAAIPEVQIPVTEIFPPRA